MMHPSAVEGIDAKALKEAIEKNAPPAKSSEPSSESESLSDGMIALAMKNHPGLTEKDATELLRTYGFM